MLIAQSCSADAVNIELSLADDSMEKGLVELRVEMFNDSPSAIRFLPWGTAMESTLNGAAFKVVDVLSGEEVPYTGRMVKRRAPEESDYMAVGIGQKTTNLLVISDAYRFCPEREYSVSVQPKFYDVSYNLIEVQNRAIKFFINSSFELCNS